MQILLLLAGAKTLPRQKVVLLRNGTESSLRDMQLLKNKHIIKHLCQHSSMKIWIFSRFGRFKHTHIHGNGDVHLRGWDYMQADGLGEGGVSDMFIGLHNIITLQAYVDRIAVPDKNYAMRSSSLALSCSHFLCEYKLNLHWRN